ISLRKAFVELEIGDFKQLETIDFIAGRSEFHISANLVLDLMTKIPGLENLTFDDCLQAAPIAEVEGIKVPFLHINQLILAKEATKRPKFD
ncbi:MAG: hypothetical protein ACKVOU_09060, partial [Cytophagales bacterium]